MTMSPMHETWRHALIGMIRKLAYRRREDGSEFTLASGKKSRHYFDLRMLTLRPDALTLIANIMADRFTALGLSIDAVAGVPLAGCPIATAVSLELMRRGHMVTAVYVRKEPKNHGTGNLILIEAAMRIEDVVLVDDVLTTGGSLQHAVTALENNNIRVRGALAVLDRRPPDDRRFTLGPNSVLLNTLFTAEEIVPDFDR